MSAIIFWLLVIMPTGLLCVIGDAIDKKRLKETGFNGSWGSTLTVIGIGLSLLTLKTFYFV